MTNKIEILRTWSNRVTFEEVLDLAKGKTLASNLQIDAILQDDKAREKNSSLFPCWTGDVIVYPAIGEAFGKFVKDNGIIFDVPKKYQGTKNIALVLSHPDLKLKKDKYGTKFITASKIKVVENFPEPSGWYHVDPETGIPQGERVTSADKTARYLWREVTPSLRPVSRGYYFDVGIRRVVVCDDGFDVRLGVAVSTLGKKRVNSDE